MLYPHSFLCTESKLLNFTDNANAAKISNFVKRRVPSQSMMRHTILQKRPILMPRPRLPPPRPILTKPREPVKELPKKQEAEKMDVTPAVDPPSTDKPCVGNYELNELMTKMVDAELDDIMPKVQEELSSVIASQKGIFECDAVIKKASDGLRDVLGLNVTKRLLNVYNSLYVKIKFHGQPNKDNLREFLQKYRFRSFARKSVNIFVAKLRSIEDFDKLFSANEVRCGPVKISVSPVYSFTTCPPNLITKYTNTSSEEETSKTDNDIATDDGEPSVTDNNKRVSIKPSPTKPDANTLTKKTESVDTANKAISKNMASKTAINAPIDKNKTQIKEPVSENMTSEKATLVAANKTVSNSTTSQKSGSEMSTETIEKATTAEEKQIKPPQKATVMPPKSTNTTISTPVKPASNAAETSQKSTNPPKATGIPQKSTSATASTQSTPKPALNTAVMSQKSTNTATKTQQSTNTATKTQQSINTTAKTQLSTNTAAKIQQSTNTIPKTQQSTKPATTAAATSLKPTSATVTTLKTQQKSPKLATTLQKSATKNDYDELDDHDILALISQGIVLDECSGSEED